MIRLSVGLETLDDILWDIGQALERRVDMNSPRYPSLTWPWVGLLLCVALLGQEYLQLATGPTHRSPRIASR